MIILSWNIQNGRGCDGNISLDRIARVIRDMCEPDVICLQEVARGLSLNEEKVGPDQVAGISQLFPEYEVVFGAAVDARAGGSSGDRWQFGNLTLSRLPVLSVFHHALPQPAECGIRHMPRQAIEITVAAANGPLRVTNTHLEFHSARQRLAQIKRLRELHDQAVSNQRTPSCSDAAGPYQSLDRPENRVICGDFNMGYDFEEYSAMLDPLPNSKTSFCDAWQVVNSNRPHDPTCGIFDNVQWPQGPHCRDFFFTSDAVADAVREVTVDTVTDASDHQPLALRLSDA